MTFWVLLAGAFYLYVTWNGDINVDAEIAEALQLLKKELPGY